jgi:hypothetical protein
MTILNRQALIQAIRKTNNEAMEMECLSNEKLKQLAELCGIDTFFYSTLI